MRLQWVVCETQGDPKEHGLGQHVEQMEAAIEEARRGAAIGVQAMTLSTVMVGDQIRYSSIAATMIGDMATESDAAPAQ